MGKIFLTFFLLLNVFGFSEINANPSSQELFVDASEAKLFCRAMGRGNPIIVIHGGPGLTQDYLLPNMSKLAEQNFVIFYDQRGCGKSTGLITSESISLDSFLKDIESIRKHFDLEKVTLLGHSWGGFLGMHYAIAYPQSVNKLILLNSIPASSDEFFLFLEEYVRRTSPLQELHILKNKPEFAAGDPDIMERYYRLMFRTYCYDPEMADLLNLRMTREAALNGSKVYSLLSSGWLLKPYNLHESLKKLQNPTLIIHGDTDPIPLITAENIHKSIYNSKFFVIKNCGHFPYVEQPQELFRHLNYFLSSQNK